MVILKVKDNSKDAKAFLEFVKTLPFVSVEEKLPNPETAKAMRDAEKGIGVHKFDNFEALINDLDS